MKIRFKPANHIMALLAVSGLGLEATKVHAESENKRDDRGGLYGPENPNSSYQAGPHIRIYITKRSWLDAGTEVLPGDRKFTDYARPPGYSFGRGNNNRSIDRQPLDPPSDMERYPQAHPFY